MCDFPIILASGSPRRRELLTHVVEDFVVLSVDVDESKRPDETALQYINRMVADKAVASAAYLNQVDHDTDANQSLLASVKDANALLLLTADTIGVLPNGNVLLKPTDYDDAKAMWQSMSNTVHDVWTAVQVTLVKKTTLSKATVSKTAVNQTTDDSGRVQYHVIKQQSLLEQTSVYFTELTEQDMQTYWQTGEPADKAGGYAIQGRGAVWVRRIEGSYTNVVGLPLAQTKALIEQAKQWT